MSDLSYKGFTGSIEVSIEDSCLHGRILFIEDIITYESNSVEHIKTAFNDAVDRYIAYCQENGKEPNKPFSGTFNVRTGKELHRKASIKARQQGKSLNEFVIAAISDAVNGSSVAAINSAFAHIYANSNIKPSNNVAEVWSK